MIFDSEIPDALACGLVLSTVGLVWIILLVRVFGLRSFSKMTNFDFVMTIAVGSLLAGVSQSTSWGSLVQSVTAITALFILQFTAAYLRQRSETFLTAIQNDPVMLLENGVICENALRTTRVSQGDLIAKLREANALEMSNVRAVVLETTGDISVLHGPEVDEIMLRGVTRIG
ncbi:DUF421 domain-containing protein [Roseobacter sp. GAI101]|uniref:DUF421 domain-containing protein n=1 Tax=Roseobacter sp. (strain GAI101) TaxID=391589 RepID=UPI0001871620|nr:YetF domain-containing protein [Roseobacter sp. GAI101]EEB85428.1 conserved hypothetical protein [Roseobacter sp. GAI101]